MAAAVEAFQRLAALDSQDANQMMHVPGIANGERIVGDSTWRDQDAMHNTGTSGKDDRICFCVMFNV
jgi:hypothetical protein